MVFDLGGIFDIDKLETTGRRRPKARANTPLVEQSPFSREQSAATPPKEVLTNAIGAASVQGANNAPNQENSGLPLEPPAEQVPNEPPTPAS